MATILEILQQAPGHIATAAVKVAQAKEAVDDAKHDLKTAQSSATIKNQEAKNAEILKAMVALDQDVQEAEAKLIKAKTDFELATINHDRIYNTWISARKIGGLNDMEIQTIRGNTIHKKDE